MTDALLNATYKIREGDLILVSFPINDKTNNPARKYDGEQFVVKRKRKPICNKGGDIYLYELYGAESKLGVPYSFLTEQLIKL